MKLIFYIKLKEKYFSYMLSIYWLYLNDNIFKNCKVNKNIKNYQIYNYANTNKIFAIKK